MSPGYFSWTWKQQGGVPYQTVMVSSCLNKGPLTKQTNYRDRWMSRWMSRESVRNTSMTLLSARQELPKLALS